MEDLLKELKKRKIIKIICFCIFPIALCGIGILAPKSTALATISLILTITSFIVGRKQEEHIHFLNKKINDIDTIKRATKKDSE